MTPSARDVLIEEVMRVTDEQYPRPDADPECVIHAVFSQGSGDFLGLVTAIEIAHYPKRIFADLLPQRPYPRIREDATVEQVHRMMEGAGRPVVAVMNDEDEFQGVATRSRLLEVLLDRHRTLSHALQMEKERLRRWSARLGDLNKASGALIGLMAQSQSEPNVVRKGLELLATLIGARYGAVGIFDDKGALHDFYHVGIGPDEAERIGALPTGKGLLGVVVRENRPLRLTDLQSDPRSAGFPPHHPPMKTLLAVPISDEGRIFGRVYLCEKSEGRPFSKDDERLALTYAHSLALAIIQTREQRQRLLAEQRATRLLNDNRRLTQCLFDAQERERRAIARELHDELGQYIVAMQAEVETIRVQSEKQNPAINRSAEAVAEVLTRVYDTVHGLMQKLRPALLDELGLVAALREMIGEFGAHNPKIHCKFTLYGNLEELSETIKITACRIVQECLNNVAAHAGADLVEVIVCRSRACEKKNAPCELFPFEGGMESCLRLVVEDNGRGFSKQSPDGGLGILGMQERVAALGGTYVMESQAGQGVRIAVKLPLQETGEIER